MINGKAQFFLSGFRFVCESYFKMIGMKKP